VVEKALTWSFETVEDVGLAGAYLLGATVIETVFRRCDLTRANLDRVNAAGARFIDVRASAGRFVKADLAGAVFERVDLDGSLMTRASMVGAELVDVRLRGAGLERTDMEGARLARVDLRDATLARTWLCGAKLTAVDFAGATLDEVYVDVGTRLWACTGIAEAIIRSIHIGDERCEGAMARERLMALAARNPDQG
jgi:uncharacterized protein YjbI with pentapeptide repeats